METIINHEVNEVNNIDIRDQLNYILNLVKDGFMDADQAIHEIKELKDIYHLN